MESQQLADTAVDKRHFHPTPANSTAEPDRESFAILKAGFFPALQIFHLERFRPTNTTIHSEDFTLCPSYTFAAKPLNKANSINPAIPSIRHRTHTNTTPPTMSIQHVTSLAQLEEVFAKNTYVVVDFFATWCPPCKAIAPVYEKLAAKHGADGHFAFAKVNVEEAVDAAQKYRVQAMPTFLFFKEGQQVMVHGQLDIKGANPPALTAAADKIGGLAAARKAKAEAEA